MAETRGDGWINVTLRELETASTTAGRASSRATEGSISHSCARENLAEGDTDHPIPSAEYRVIARNVPSVSVDLLVHHDGGSVPGERRNEPATGEWFVPGGTVVKRETLVQAVHRAAARSGVPTSSSIGAQ